MPWVELEKKNSAKTSRGNPPRLPKDDAPQRDPQRKRYECTEYHIFPSETAVRSASRGGPRTGRTERTPHGRRCWSQSCTWTTAS